MDLGLAGKVAIVNGASLGISYAIARLLVEEGARVAMAARRIPSLEAAAERIRSETGGFSCLLVGIEFIKVVKFENRLGLDFRKNLQAA